MICKLFCDVFGGNRKLTCGLSPPKLYLVEKFRQHVPSKTTLEMFLWALLTKNVLKEDVRWLGPSRIFTGETFWWAYSLEISLGNFLVGKGYQETSLEKCSGEPPHLIFSPGSLLIDQGHQKSSWGNFLAQRLIENANLSFKEALCGLPVKPSKILLSTYHGGQKILLTWYFSFILKPPKMIYQWLLHGFPTNFDRQNYTVFLQ